MTKEKNKGGRPTKYDENYHCAMVDKYIQENQDAYESDNMNTTNTKQVVKLPTISGFSLYIDIPERTIYDWKDRYPVFSQSLERIVKQQKIRLLNKGLSGDYNSTIAKLILSANHGMREKSDVTTNDDKIETGVIVLPSKDQ